MSIKRISGGVCAPIGFTAAGLHCGVRKNQAKKDIAMIFSEVECSAAAVYTQNKVYGAPIIVTRENISNGHARAVICNSGNANTANPDGVEKARRMCELCGEALGIDPSDVIVASTGVIGLRLDLEPIEQGIKDLSKSLSRDGGNNAASAIMTTDTKVKEIALETEIGGKTVRLGAIAKGSGMIHPNMATMLSFITTDLCISPEMLSRALKLVVDDTYNMISVDGDTSTNDMVSILASGLAGNAQIVSECEDFDKAVALIREAALYLSRLIASDGEGATRLLTCHVSSAPDIKTAKTVAKSVIASSLVKSMFFGADANWGRILCAMGYSGAEFDIEKSEVSLSSAAGSIEGCKNGCVVEFDEDLAAKILAEKEIDIFISLNQGDDNATAWGCDLTYEYVKINGDYRS